MKKCCQCLLTILLMGATFTLTAQNAPALIKGEEVTYSDGNTVLKGYVAYNEKQQGKRPVILVVHEWWGCGDYVRKRANSLAELGYIAIAVDMYGEGKIANNPGEAQAFAGSFYKDPSLGKSRLEAAVKKSAPIHRQM